MASVKATSPTVLVVDDDRTLLSALESVLGTMGYRVRTTADAEAAYALLGATPVDAVLLDIHMPTMSGLALYLAMVHRWPELEGRIALMSGDPDSAEVRPWLATHPCVVFRKPFRGELVAGWLSAALAKRRSKARAG